MSIIDLRSSVRVFPELVLHTVPHYQNYFARFANFGDTSTDVQVFEFVGAQDPIVTNSLFPLFNWSLFCLSTLEFAIGGILIRSSLVSCACRLHEPTDMLGPGSSPGWAGIAHIFLVWIIWG